jgi:uncharacterized protein (TIGR03435 family)
LAVHREVKQMAVYTLVVEGKGAKLTPTQNKTEPAGASGRVDVYSERSGPRLMGKGASMAQLADGLARVMRGPVLDRTGIEGQFDFDVDCPTDDPLAQAGPERPDLASSVAVAIRKLGLMLKPGKGPVETLVVDHVERPSAN